MKMRRQSNVGKADGRIEIFENEKAGYDIFDC